MLPAMLRGARRKRAADLAVQRSARPKSAGLVKAFNKARSAVRRTYEGHGRGEA
jgi:hypothetical protein